MASQTILSSVRPAVTSLTRRIVGNRKVKTSLAAVGLSTAVGLGVEYRRLKSVNHVPDKAEEKRVLAIPFNRLNLVERKSPSWFQDNPNEVEVRELVDLIHHAASDPTISSLYGHFGEGSKLAQAGWADLEEVRDALRVFRESHRRHPEPNINHSPPPATSPPPVARKPMYAYADSFASLEDSGNKDYYIASIFTHVHMQFFGELNLLGMMWQEVFVRGLLEENGVKMHVFRQGKYKFFTNAYTERKMNRYHRENITAVLQALDLDVGQDILASRCKNSQLGSSIRPIHDVWRMIHNECVGARFCAPQYENEFVDYSPLVDPLPYLLRAAQNEDFKAAVKAGSMGESDFERFDATTCVTLYEYADQIKKKAKRTERLERLQRLGSAYPLLSKLLSVLGLAATNDAAHSFSSPVDRIAVIHLNGSIDDTTSLVTRHAIHEACQKDVKAIVLRVSSPGGILTASETILRQLQATGLPVVVSFGNMAASGGYYVSTNAERIFSSRKTLTGSIGVFGIRPDLTQLAAKYGISAQHVSTGDMSALNEPLHPMTRPMKQAMESMVSVAYKQFKFIVKNGRGLDEDYVESIAQGRVYTGDQAKTNGLVDELGGLHRAIAYAKREFASEDAKVEVFPKQMTLFDMLLGYVRGDVSFTVLGSYMGFQLRGGASGQDSEFDSEQLLRGVLDWMFQASSGGRSGAFSGIMLTADEDMAIRCFMKQARKRQKKEETFLLPAWFWD